MTNHLFLNFFNCLVAVGSSKGYGFVEFTCNRAESEVIRSKLDGKSHDNSALHCDFVKDSIVDFEQLNSSCLCVGNLPLDFADDSHLRKLFSPVAEPLFCRVSQDDLYIFTCFIKKTLLVSILSTDMLKSITEAKKPFNEWVVF